jgi:hypothetical protein
MISQIFSNHWVEIILIVLAINFNMYAMEAENGKYTMGSFIYKYKNMVELVNWLIFTGLVIYLSYIFSWYLLISLIVLPIIGALSALLLRGFTQLVYLFGMPVFLIIFIIKIIN